MTTFLVVAHDAADAVSASRRAGARPSHLARIIPTVESGQIIIGGAVLDSEGRPVGSAFFAEFETEEELRTWLDEDPYVTNRVWREIQITRVKLAVQDRKILG